MAGFDGLASLFRANPARERMNVTAGMLPNSGFAAPLLAYSLGSDMAQAEQWDQGQADFMKNAYTQSMKMEANKEDQAFFEKVLGSSIDALKAGDVAGANNIISAYASKTGNPLLAQMATSIKFYAKPENDYYFIQDQQTGKKIAIRQSALGDISNLMSKGSPTPDQIKQILTQNSVVMDPGHPTDMAPGHSLVGPAPNGNGLQSLYDQPTADKVPTDGELRSYQKGAQTVTEAYNASTGQWEPKGTGPKWNPKEGDGAPRKETDIVKDIRTTANEIAGRLGDKSFMDALMQSTIKDPKVLEAMKSRKDPAIQDLISTLQYYKGEYFQRTGKQWQGGTYEAPSSGGAADYIKGALGK